MERGKREKGEGKGRLKVKRGKGEEELRGEKEGKAKENQE